MTEDEPPTRAEVERRWRALIAGEVSREDTHRWAKPWVEERWAEIEPMVESALQSLHGFDITCDPQHRNLVRHGGHEEGRPYYHSDRQIEVELERWLQSLEEFDVDPDAFRERMRARASRFVEEEAVAKARAAEAPQLQTLPERVRSSALGLPNGEIMWPRREAHAAIEALAGSGALILGLDLRSDGPANPELRRRSRGPSAAQTP